MRCLLLLALLALASCHLQPTSSQDTSVRGLVPDLALSMTDTGTGQTLTEANLRGAVVLVYFGYTHCPDVCPATLYNLTRIEKRMGPEAARLKILFVTVDPDRDNPTLLAQYAKLFGTNVYGLRGTPDQLYRLAQRYRVVFSVIKTPDYQVMHSSAVYVFNAQGQAEFLIGGLESGAPDLSGIAADLKAVADE